MSSSAGFPSQSGRWAIGRGLVRKQKSDIQIGGEKDFELHGSAHKECTGVSQYIYIDFDVGSVEVLTVPLLSGWAANLSLLEA